MARFGLFFFVFTVLVNVAGIFLDFAFLVCKLPTITEISRSRPLVGLLILIINVLAAEGLAIHFFLADSGE